MRGQTERTPIFFTPLSEKRNQRTFRLSPYSQQSSQLLLIRHYAH